jgi:hypothetical protein
VTGTEGGVIFVYGDGFQNMRTVSSSAGGEIYEVAHLHSFHDDKLLVVLGNNAVYVLSLPSLDTIAFLDPSWLPSKFGDVSSVHIDETTVRNFAYIGTSGGFVRVLDLLPIIRICGYTISLADVGLSGNMLVADLALCPKVRK